MDSLKSQSAFARGLSLSIGACVLEEVDLGVLTALKPYGDPVALGGALKKAHGVGLPDPNRALGTEGARVIWFGRNAVLLAGPMPDKSLAQHGAVVDVSDGWVAVSLSGAGTEDVLARLVPVDMRQQSFKQGHTARTLLGHMEVSISRIGGDTFVILAFRSMALTLVHELKRAMEGVASRG